VPRSNTTAQPVTEADLHYAVSGLLHYAAKCLALGYISSAEYLQIVKAIVTKHTIH
jgi:hypothetical protein